MEVRKTCGAPIAQVECVVCSSFSCISASLTSSGQISSHHLFFFVSFSKFSSVSQDGSSKIHSKLNDNIDKLGWVIFHSECKDTFFSLTEGEDASCEVGNHLQPRHLTIEEVSFSCVNMTSTTQLYADQNEPGEDELCREPFSLLGAISILRSGTFL